MSTNWSNVERTFIEVSGKKESYDIEKAPLIEVQNVYELGKIVALTFLEWVWENPSGVVALPTGKTPEYFIKTLERYKSKWDDESVQHELRSHGYSYDSFPDTKNLKFVMLDEFFPMLPTHRNSFCNYIRMFYTSLLGIPADNILDFDLVSHGILDHDELKALVGKDVDLSLLTRDAENEDEARYKSILIRVQGYCDTYEQKIREMGGLGYFLGGIGPDGHIAFNQEGCDHDCKTRYLGLYFLYFRIESFFRRIYMILLVVPQTGVLQLSHCCGRCK
jgi:glucosamine-6-phosphate deaminase